MQARRSFLALSLATLTLATGCQAPVVPSRPTGKPSPSSSVAPAAPGARAQAIALSELPRVVSQVGQPMELIGKVKLISDKGLGVVSNNSGSLISDQGGNAISDNGAGAISDNGAGLVSDQGLGAVSSGGGGLRAGGRFALLADAPNKENKESLLADAQIEVLDAAGRVLVGADKKPLTATTDKQGGYQFKAVLPAENLIFRIRLYNGGQLFAFVTKDAGSQDGARTLDIDTASSLGAAYVLEKYVRKRQEVLDRLPGKEADALRDELAAAQVKLAKAPSYKPEELVVQTESLRAQAPQLDSELKAIEAILLAGQKDLGNGGKATQTSLAAPMGLALDPQGNLYIGESTGGRIRKVAPDGTISLLAGRGTASTLVDGAPALDANFGICFSLTRGPDGSFYVPLASAMRVARIMPDGTLKLVAGTGQAAQGASGGAASATPVFWPGVTALGADGTLYIGELPRDGSAPGRLLHVDARGQLAQVPCPADGVDNALITGLVVETDGTIWIAVSVNKLTTVSRQKPGGAWETVADGLYSGTNGRLAPAPGGGVYALDALNGRILRIDAAGQTGVVSSAKDGSPVVEPVGVVAAPDGTLYAADATSALVYARSPQGAWRVVAGATGLSQNGDALSVAINQPSGLAVDPQGRLVIAEAGSSTIKRLDGQSISVIAGTVRGASGDGGPALQAAFNSVGGLIYRDGELILADVENYKVRRIGADGIVSTLAGDGQPGDMRGQTSVPAISPFMRRPTSFAVAPDGTLYWTDNEDSAIYRLKGDMVELVAGGTAKSTGDSGDGGPALEAKFNHPLGLAFDKAGNLYVADTGNLRVRKIDAQGTITTYAGLPMAQLLPKLIGGAQASEEGIQASKAALIGPAALCFDAQGNLYLTEAGTANIAALGAAEQSLPIPIELLPKVPARIRKIAPDGTITTVAGPGTKLLNDPNSDNTLKVPLAMIIDGQGRLIIADTGLNQVKLLPKGSF